MQRTVKGWVHIFKKFWKTRQLDPLLTCRTQTYTLFFFFFWFTQPITNFRSSLLPKGSVDLPPESSETDRDEEPTARIRVGSVPHVWQWTILNTYTIYPPPRATATKSQLALFHLQPTHSPPYPTPGIILKQTSLQHLIPMYFCIYL